MNRVLGLAVLFLSLTVSASLVWAQTPGTLRGRVLDPSRASVPGAVVTVTGPGNLVKTAETDASGSYSAPGLPAGTYSVRAAAPGFSQFESSSVEVAAARIVNLDLTLNVAVERQEVTVADQQQVEVDPGSNASSVVLKGEDLNMFSDNPDDLQSELQALAGPSVGPNGGQIFIDGFSNGQLPPKESIREIRINSNPFSAEFDRVGFGRIEILTRPGTDKLRGSANFSFNDGIMNSRNPYSATKPPHQERQFFFNAGGSLNKKTSFNLEAQHRGADDQAFINATGLDSAFKPVTINQNVATPNARTSFGPRIDYALTPNITLQGRYVWTRNTSDNNGVGGFSLLSRALNNENTQQTVNLTGTAVLGARAVNESRFQYNRTRSQTTGISTTPGISVLDSFTGGGANTSLGLNNQNNFEFQNFTSITQGKHFTKFGIRIRRNSMDSYSTSNYNGTFTFTSLAAYGLTMQGIASGLPMDQIRALGGGPSQYTVAGGTPLAGVSQVDASPFIQDDWKLRPNVTLSAGLRYEIQSNISDKRAWAPRVGLAWGVGNSQGRTRAPKTVIRVGAGVFYDRVQENLTLDAIRQNGVVQQTFNIQNPAFFPAAPPVEQLTANKVPQNIRIVSSDIQAPSIFQTAFTVERQLPKNVTVSTSYTISRGLHQLRSRNLNAPLGGVFPLGSSGPVYQYESSGMFKQSQLSVNVTGRVNPNIQIFGFYVFGQAHSNTDGAGSFPANNYDLSSEWSRAGFDVRHRMVAGGNITAPYAVQISPMIVLSSAPPFNITTGRDLNGDTLFNDRPSFASSASLPQNVRVTPWGTFDLVPVPGETYVPRNFGTAYGQVNIGMRLSRTWGFGERRTGSQGGLAGGPGGGGPPHGMGGPGGGGPPAGAMVMREGGMFGGGGSSGKRFSLTASVNARNLINTVNPGTPTGNLSSTLFGQSLGLAGFGGFMGGGPGGGFGGGQSANRRIEVSLRLNF